MSEPTDVTLETDDETTNVRVHDDEGEVESGDTTVRFSFDGASSDGDDGSDEQPNGQSRGIAPLSDVPEDGTIRFEARRDGRGVGCILHRNGETVMAWENSCPHEPDVPLDPGGGARVSHDQLVCPKHGARFQREETGVCTAGPCAGDTLATVDVAADEGTVVLTDDRFEWAERY